MSEKYVPFKDYPLPTRRFYSDLLFVLMLNMAAYKLNLFGTLFCETEDPRVFMQFHEDMPYIRQLMGM